MIKPARSVLLAAAGAAKKNRHRGHRCYGPRQRRRSSDDYNDLPTTRTTLAARYVRVLVFCNSCRHSADADLRAIVDAGQGDVPLTELQFRCSQCGTDQTEFVVTSGDNPQLW